LTFTQSAEGPMSTTAVPNLAATYVSIDMQVVNKTVPKYKISHGYKLATHFTF